MIRLGNDAVLLTSDEVLGLWKAIRRAVGRKESQKSFYTYCQKVGCLEVVNDFSRVEKDFRSEVE